MWVLPSSWTWWCRVGSQSPCGAAGGRWCPEGQGTLPNTDGDSLGRTQGWGHRDEDAFLGESKKMMRSWH